MFDKHAIKSEPDLWVRFFSCFLSCGELHLSLQVAQVKATRLTAEEIAT